MGGRFSFFFFVYFNLKNWMKLVVFRNRRESDYVTFYSLYNPNNESYILSPPAIYYA